MVNMIQGIAVLTSGGDGNECAIRSVVRCGVNRDG